jgi:TfoX N-terminal domain
MAYNEMLTNRMREALANVPNVTEKNMFRGVAFMVNGKLCLSAGEHEMMCRIDPAIHDRLTQKRMSDCTNERTCIHGVCLCSRRNPTDNK